MQKESDHLTQGQMLILAIAVAIFGVSVLLVGFVLVWRNLAAPSATAYIAATYSRCISNSAA